MPRKRSITLTEAELRLMRLFWQRGESTIADLVQSLPEGEPLAYNSVLTTVRVLERKGYLEHRQEARAFLYSACIAESDASASEVRHVLQRFFGNSPERLLLSLLGDQDLPVEELLRLKQAIFNAPDDPAVTVEEDGR
jgi:predicted transcriptional regulator